MSPLAPRPAAAGPSQPLPGTAPVMATTTDSVRVRLAAFAALAAFGVGHWALLVEQAPVGRMLLVVLVAIAGAGALALLGTAGGRLAPAAHPMRWWKTRVRCSFPLPASTR